MSTQQERRLAGESRSLSLRSTSASVTERNGRDFELTGTTHRLGSIFKSQLESPCCGDPAFADPSKAKTEQQKVKRRERGDRLYLEQLCEGEDVERTVRLRSSVRKDEPRQMPDLEFRTATSGTRRSDSS